MAIRQIDNSSFTLRRLYTLYDSRELSDIQLKVGHHKFDAHRLVLCMNSDVFKTMLTSSTWPEAQSRRIVLQEDAECVEAFEDFLKYLYNGKVQLDGVSVLPLLVLADKYNVSDLSRSCLEYMSDHCSPVTEKYIMSWLQYAIMCGYHSVEDICTKYVTVNFESVIKTSEFQNISKDVLLTFLERSDLVVKSEYSLYLAMTRWLDNHKSENKDISDQMFIDVMSRVRFPMMNLSQLASLKADPNVQEHKEFYLNKIFLSMEYHTLPTRQNSKQAHAIGVSESYNHYIPRIYPTETWSTCINVEGISTVPVGELRGAFFNTPMSCSDIDQHNLCDWHIMFYPKGVVFDPCLMISVPNNLTNPGATLKTVRLALATSCEIKSRFKITVLVMSGESHSKEFVYSAITKDAIFDSEYSIFNFENIIPFQDVFSYNSPFKVGRDDLSIRVVIRPMSN